MIRTCSTVASLTFILGLTACDPGPTQEACESLCDLTPFASQLEGACVSSFITSRGYDTDHPDCVTLSEAFARGTATTAQCNACYRSIGVADAHCSDARSMCFGGAPDVDGGSTPMTDGGIGPSDAGPAMGSDAGPDPAGVDTCVDLCALTPTTTDFEAECTSGFIRGRGYDVEAGPCQTLAAAFGAGVANATLCNACYSAIAVTDGDCAAAHALCF